MLPSVCDLDGDGRYGETGGAAPCGDEAGPTPTFWAADLPDPNSTITVRLRVRDFWGAVREDTATIHVTSYGEFFDPLVHISPDDINEGGHLTAWTSGPPDFASSYNDANVYLWDLDGDGIYGDSPGESGKYVSFDLPGEYLVSVLATVVPSGQYYRARTSATIQVTNVPPTPDPGGPYTVAQGAAVPLYASATDPGGPSDIAAYAWDLDGDGIFGESGLAAAPCGDEVGPNPTFYAADVSGPKTVALRVYDTFGAFGEDTATIRIHGSPDAPVVVADGPSILNPGDPVTLTASPSGNWSGDISYAWDLLIFGKVMQYLFSSGRNGRSILAQADVPSAAKRVAFFT
jgi:hypothetical protein